MVTKLSSLAALASISALGAFLVVAQGHATALPTLRPTLAQPAIQTVAPQQVQPTTPDGRAVRVVYPSPFASK